jgi:hypothetical protein
METSRILKPSANEQQRGVIRLKKSWRVQPVCFRHSLAGAIGRAGNQRDGCTLATAPLLNDVKMYHWHCCSGGVHRMGFKLKSFLSAIECGINVIGAAAALAAAARASVITHTNKTSDQFPTCAPRPHRS